VAEISRKLGSSSRDHPDLSPESQPHGEAKPGDTALYNRPHKEWDKHLSKSVWFLRNRKNEATGFSPAELIFSYTPKKPGEWAHAREEETTNLPAMDWINSKKERAQLQKESLQTKHTKRKPPSKSPKQRPLEEGDKVLIRNRMLSRAIDNVCAGLNPRWQGPFTISRRVTNNIYILKEGTKEERKVHSKDLKRFYE